MSGHSKWHSIKYKKAATDSKKGAIFTRISRNITMAAREAGGDAETNFKLRMAIDQARAVNMPKENITRAIKRGIGQDTEAQLQEAIYEGYGPAGVAIIVKTVTDNTNRTVSNLRHTLSKHGGSLGESGSVMWNFELKGALRVELENANKDEIELSAIESGADDIAEEDETLLITANPKNLQNIKKSLEEKNIKIAYADMEYIPKNKVDLDENAKKKLQNLTDALDELEDVQDYFTNEN